MLQVKYAVRMYNPKTLIRKKKCNLNNSIFSFLWVIELFFMHDCLSSNFKMVETEETFPPYLMSYWASFWHMFSVYGPHFVAIFVEKITILRKMAIYCHVLFDQ